MIKIMYVAFVYIVLLSILLPILSRAATYGGEKADAWYYFSWMEENGDWHDWIGITDENKTILYSDLTLKVGQPVKCKIVALTHIQSAISFSIYEPGVTKAFDVIEGKPHDEVIRYGVGDDGYFDWLEPETQKEYTWVLQTNNKWIGGRASLNGFCQIVLPSMDEEDLRIDTSFANPYIENEEWTGPSYSSGDDDDNTGIINTNDNNSSTPGFETIILLLAIISVMMLVQHQKKKNR